METKCHILPYQTGIIEATKDAHFQIFTGWCLALLPPGKAPEETGTTIWNSGKPRLGISILPLLRSCPLLVPKETTFLFEARGPCGAFCYEREGGGCAIALTCPVVIQSDWKNLNPVSLANTWHTSPQKSFTQTRSVRFSEVILCLVGASSGPSVEREILKIKEPPPGRG